MDRFHGLIKLESTPTTFAEAKTLELATIDLTQSKYIHVMICKAYLVQLVQNIFNQVGPTFMNTTNEIYSMLGTVDFL